MIVYGDPSYEATLASLSDGFRTRCRNLPASPSLDELRALLIEAGGLEQAVHDADLDEVLILCERNTDQMANAFVSRWSGAEPVVPPAIEDLPPSDEKLTVKLPEGFAFYALYPEAYVVATQRWMEERSPSGPVLVVGVRSIGTTLSAVVTVALSAAGVSARRMTVRPTGHPFDRHVQISPSAIEAVEYALIVDEGPGLSGSSMASVAQALTRAGLPREQIAFFPGHGGMPGEQASEDTRRWWNETPRYVVPTEVLRWQGQNLLESIVESTDGEVAVIEDITGGSWREALGGDPGDWPGVAGAFERPKLRVFRTDGSSVLWKFVGLMVPETTLGFARQEWIEGSALRKEDVGPEVVAHLGQHIAAVAGPPLSLHEAVKARERLVQMARVNLAEAGLTNPILAPTDGEGGPSAGDYRLAPWEWRRLSNGEIAKAGRIAPTLDHTVVGQQPLAWDVAGAMVEWELDVPEGLPHVPDLDFHRLAYAAFRMGQCSMCAGMSDESEARRLRRDKVFYRNAILRLNIADLPPPI